MMIDCRLIIENREIEQVVDLHGLVWDASDRDAIPAHVMTALSHVGGILLGAFDRDRVVAFSLAFPAIRDNRLILWSHATGVLPEYQGRGIGRALKWLQRDLAIARGFDCISWTFDPLQSGNANFNIHHLGCTCRHYHNDFYGEVADGLNKGLPTDRLEATWWVGSQRVQEYSKGASRQSVPIEQLESALFVLEGDKNRTEAPSRIMWPDSACTRVLLEIPADINELRQTTISDALEWRLATRQAFTQLFASGFAATDFLWIHSADGRRRCAYLLEKLVLPTDRAGRLME